MKLKTHKRKAWSLIGTMMVCFISLVMASTVVSCSSMKNLTDTDTIYVAKTEYVDKIVVDSVWQDRWHTIYTSGDTIYARDSIYVYKYKAMHDTLRLTDTIYVTKTEYVEVEVEKEPSFWEKIGMMAKGGVLSVVLVLVGVGLLRIVDKYKVKR